MKSMTVITTLLMLTIAFGQKLTVQGSTTVLPIVQAEAEGYMESNPDADITIRGGGSGTGIAALLDGSTDIASSSRPMKVKEMQTARVRGVNPVATVIALDGIVIIVHSSNLITNLSREDLKKIYTGKITRWEKIGGTNGTIVVVSRDVASGTFEVFNEKALENANLTDQALMLASNLEVARTVEQTPGAIGYVGLGYVSDKVKKIEVEGVTPSESTVKDNSYPLARSLYLYTNNNPAGPAKSFIDYILSIQGQKVVKEQGFVPVK